MGWRLYAKACHNINKWIWRICCLMWHVITWISKYKMLEVLKGGFTKKCVKNMTKSLGDMQHLAHLLDEFFFLWNLMWNFFETGMWKITLMAKFMSNFNHFEHARQLELISSHCAFFNSHKRTREKKFIYSSNLITAVKKITTLLHRTINNMLFFSMEGATMATASTAQDI